MNTIAYFEIQSSKPEELIQFYSTLCEWIFEKEENLPHGYWRILNAGINGGLLQRPAKIPPQEFGANAFVCSIEVEDFDSISKKITDAGGRITLPKFKIPKKCYQGYFVDPEGNSFGIFEVNTDL